MERSQSYTSFETSGSNGGSINCHSSRLKNQHFNLSRTNLSSNNISNTSSSYNTNYKNKFASTSALNLRKALEMRQTQLQKQQQQQQELLQRQQWLLLFEQRRQQQQQQYAQLQLAQSSDNLNAPFFLSSLNGLQLLQKRRQKMMQQQKSTTSMDELDFPMAAHHHDDEDENEDFDMINNIDNTNNNNNNNEHDEAVILRARVVSHQNSTTDTDEHQLTLTAGSSSHLSAPLQQKLLLFQRQRPHSEAAISYRASSPLATVNPLNQSQSAASSPKTSSPIASTDTASTPIKSSERRRLQHHDQCLSFDSAISGNTTAGSSTSTTTPNMQGGAGGSNMSPLSTRHPHFGKLKRDNSLHSDSSRYSSVDSLLESRKPDPEAILINLGFAPVEEDILSRIPKRFLKPSQLRGIDTEAFVRRLQLAHNLADHSVLGYRGLLGNPDLPPSTIVAKIMQRFEVNERKKSMGSIEQTMR